MQVSSATINVSSTHSFQQTRHQRETLDLQLGQQRLHQESEHGKLTLTRQSQLAGVSTPTTSSKNPTPPAATDEVLAEDALPPELKLLKRLLEYMTQRVIKLVTAPTMRDPKDGPKPPPPRSSDPPGNPAGFGLRYQSDTTITEQEYTRFQAAGVIRTRDGKEIRFRLELAMNRRFTRYQHQQISMGTLRDPLVINLNAPSAVLDQQQFRFDLNADGKVQQMHTLRPGSGFLALDRNQDGKINNGSELFGTASGNGFQDLTSLDHDHNGWIDSNDPLFSRLSIWSPQAGDPQISSSFTSLQASGVGALYLGKAETPMQLQGSNGDRYGLLRSTGLFVTEEGSVGTIQQLDLTA